MAKSSATFDQIVFLLHGGGALGSYQVGIYKALHKDGYEPDWLIGTSIGAINSAIIAGNPPENRIEMLENFWNEISIKMPAVPDMLNNVAMERMQHFFSAQYAAMYGVPNFYKPRTISPWLGIESTADKLSYYDTSELRNTLLKFINFDYINEKHVRLSIGAVRIASGDLVYFDNQDTEITVEHVMASCALPPAFPAVSIDDHFYWDGGVHSNTQLNLLLSQREPLTYLCFMVNLFDSYGLRPSNMDEVLKRQKDILYSSHHKQSIFVYRAIHNLRHAIRVLADNLPPDKLNDPELKELIDLGQTGIIHLVRYHYNQQLSDLSSKDYEFSSPSLANHIACGERDVEKTLRNPPWNKACPSNQGLVLYDFSDNPDDLDNPFMVSG